MARIRTIKPDFWTDDALTECSLSARLLFIGTWNFADDNGNLDRSSKQLKAKIFPHDSINVEELVIELLSHELLIEYAIDNKKYLHIKNFLKHQKINRKSLTCLPEYDDSMRTHGVITEYSNPKVREGKVMEGNKTSSSKPNGFDGFDEFWDIYPKKVGKGEAKKAWRKIKQPKETLALITSAISWQKQSPDWLKEKGQFIPHPATYLNGERWMDEPTDKTTDEPENWR